MSALINKRTCKYVVIDVDTYEKVLELVTQSGGEGFPEFEYGALPVIGELTATSSILPYSLTEDGQIEVLSKAVDDFGTFASESLLSQAMQAIQRYAYSLC
jgi:hypothetical protein